MCSYQISSQVFYSTDPNYFKSKVEGNNAVSFFRANYPDTTLDNFHQQHPFNFSGNVGLASPNYLMRFGTDKIGFRFYDLPYRNDLFKDNNVIYYQSKGPYVSITGITGAKEFQAGKIIYTQTYANRLTLSFNFERSLSKGYYLRQQTYTNNFVINSHYTNLKKRWGFYAFVLNNANRSQENGGIKDRVLNDSTTNINKELMRVNLNAASRDNRQTKIMFNPWFKLNSSSDSIQLSNHYLSIKSQISFASMQYKDLGLKKDLYYSTFNYDTLKTNDSSNIRQYNNSIEYNFSRVNQKINFSAGYQNEINKVWQKHDSVFMNHKVFADLSLRNYNPADTNINRGFESSFHLQSIVSGKNSGNYKIENNSIYYLNILKKNLLYFNFMAEKRNADYIFNTWRSNHFVWNNNFAAQEQTQIQVGLKLSNNWHLSCLYQNIFKYLYFDEQQKPAQLKKTIDNFVASICYAHVFFKHLGISLAHTYQSTSKAKYYRVPENVSAVKLFYNGNLFKNNLVLQMGTQLGIYQSFKALAYMPATQAFYLQSNATTAAQPFVDVYLNARIHPVSIFLKVENILQGFVGNNYSFVPGYYQNQRAFRCGITWMFFD